MAKNLLPFKLSSTNSLLTSHCGLILFGELINKLGLVTMVNEIFGKSGSNRGYKASTYIIPLLLKFHGGGRYLEDIRQIKEDKLLRKLLKLGTIPTTAAIGEWLLRKGRSSGLKQINNINKTILHKSLSLESRISYTLDIDASEIVSNKHSALYTYKKNKGYMPIVGHLAENQLIVGSEFRSGNISPSTRNYEFMKECIKAMPKGKYITGFRADSASYQAQIINYCNDNGISYAIGGVLNSSVLKAIAAIDKNSWQIFEDGEISETYDDMSDSNHSFRLIVKRKAIFDDLLGKEYSYHVIISNRENETAADTMKWYSQRGETSENRIKELKIGFNLEYLPCGQHNANAMYFYIGCLAYNLSIILKSHILPKEFRNNKISTIRWRFYQIAAKLVKSGRIIYLKIQKQHLALLQQVRLKCQQIRFG